MVEIEGTSACLHADRLFFVNTSYPSQAYRGGLKWSRSNLDHGPGGRKPLARRHRQRQGRRKSQEE